VLRRQSVVAVASAVLVAGCPAAVRSLYEPIRAERDPGLARTVRDDAAGIEWGLLQLDRWSSLYGAKDYWITWRSLAGGAPPALGTLVPGAHPLPPPSFGAKLDKDDAARQAAVDRLFAAGDGTWAPPVFTGVVYQFMPPSESYLPTALLRFARDGADFVLELGIPESLRASYPDVPDTVRRFTLAAIAADADGDGLTDPTEALLSTDPHRADSDGDGVADGADREPLTPAGAAPRTPEQTVIADALAHYNCTRPEPVIFEMPADGAIAIRNEGCINLGFPTDRFAALPAVTRAKAYDRSVEVIHHVFKMSADRATMMVTVGDSIAFRRYLYRVNDAGAWELFKVTMPELVVAKPVP
jgi:hypothetical protein